MRYLRPTSISGVTNIEQLYLQLEQFLAASHPLETLILDLSYIGFVPPEGIIALITIARLWHEATTKRVSLRNLKPDVHKYLERMDVFSECADWMEEGQRLADQERFDRSPSSSRLLEVLPIASDEDQNAIEVSAALERANNIMGIWFAADQGEIGRLLTMLSEITSNIVHSRDLGFAVIQRYRDNELGQSGSRITIAVGDLGIGIEASLRGKPLPRGTHRRPVTGSDYILHALQLGVTSRETVAGMGLYQVQSIVGDWQGTLVIRSRRSMIRASSEGIEIRDDLADIRGTQVSITVRGSMDSIL